MCPQIAMLAHIYTHVYAHFWTHNLHRCVTGEPVLSCSAEARHMCIGKCIGRWCIDMCMGMSMDMCMDMHVDMYG